MYLLLVYMIMIDIRPESFGGHFTAGNKTLQSWQDV